MPSERVLAAFHSLLAKTSLSEKEIRESLCRARDPEYWRKLNPALTLSQKLSRCPVRSRPVVDRTHRSAVEHMERDGYFQLEGVFPLSLIRRMRSAIERVKKAGWPVVFATVYDEFWQILQIPPLVRVLEETLGPGYRIIPHLWCHYVNPVSGAKGWRPHVDGQSGSRVSIWIPFTDATIDNGCIYLIPEGRISKDYPVRFPMRRRYSMKDADALLQGMRALPTAAGSILGWHFGIIHWGSTATNGREPRISAAFEFIGCDVPPLEHELPLLEAQPGIPSFQQRLDTIGKAVVTYQRFEPQMKRFVQLGLRLQSKE